MHSTSDGENSPEEQPAAPAQREREVRFEHSKSLVPVLTQLGGTLLISTYQAGKLVVVAVRQEKLELSFHNFDRVMGVAVGADRIAVGVREQLWMLINAPEIAPQLEPKGKFDACYLARQSLFTGEIQVHDLAWGRQGLYVVNTLFSCVCQPHDRFSFVPIWKPPFISALASEDRCHLNGIAMHEGEMKYVTVLGQTDKPQGWRENKATGGCLLEVPSGRVITSGLCMPHSPRLHAGRLWLLNSGMGTLIEVNRDDGTQSVVAELPGYTRGMACLGPVAAVGLSKIRETSTFGGLPISEQRDSLRCGVALVELGTGKTLATLEFSDGVEEIFDVQWIPGIRCPNISGPHALLEGGKTIWSVPQPQAGSGNVAP